MSFTPIKVFHSVDFTTITDVRKYLSDNQHWVYCTLEDGSSVKVSDYANPEIYKHIYKAENGALEFKRFATTPDDKSGLRPRIEISAQKYRMPKKTPLHARYVLSCVEGGVNFRGMVFQFMDRTNSGGTLPTFQFELRDGKLHCRYTTIVNGDNGGTTIIPILTPEWNTGKFYTLDVFAYLSDRPDGWFRVYLDGKFVWERKNQITASSFTDRDVQVQFGEYGVKGYQLRTNVRSIRWETIDKIPTTTDLIESTPAPTTTVTPTPETVKAHVTFKCGHCGTLNEIF